MSSASNVRDRLRAAREIAEMSVRLCRLIREAKGQPYAASASAELDGFLITLTVREVPK